LYPLFLIFSASLFAGKIDISYLYNSGKSTYKVWSDNTQNLQSKLLFPVDFATLRVRYTHTYRSLSFTIYSSVLLYKKTTDGEDFDWQNDTLTVYSSSDNIIENYYDGGVTCKKNFLPSFALFAKFHYQMLKSSWYNTQQEDYVKNSSSFLNTKTLTFQQEFFQYHFGLDYTTNISKKISFSLLPSVVYAFINTKDTHLLREFYTKQKIQSLGYEWSIKTHYILDKNLGINIAFSYISLKDSQVDMHYYNAYYGKYLTYPSSYKYTNKSLSFGIYYTF